MIENTPTEIATEHVKRSALGFDEAISGPMFDAWLANHDAEVRALPDRERIARALDPEAWVEPRLTHLGAQYRRAKSLAQADAVLALFGQGGQR